MLDQATPSPLAVLVCGVEHSGTTLVSDMLRQVEGLQGGFEGGVLLWNTPREFAASADTPQNPYFKTMAGGGWGVTETALREACDTDDHAEFYRRLKAASDTIPEAARLFDKTPRYVAEITTVSARAGHPPTIIIHKDPRSSVHSDLKRAAPDDALSWYDGYVETKLRYMRRCYEGYERGRDLLDNVLTVSLEDLAFDTRRTATRLYEHVGAEFRLDHLLLKKVPFGNTRAPFVSAPIVLEHLEGLPRPLSERVRDDFKSLSDWFYD